MTSTGVSDSTTRQTHKRRRSTKKETADLKLTPLVKQEDKKQRHPKPNQRVDFETSFHIIKSVINTPTRSRSSASKHQTKVNTSIYMLYFKITLDEIK